MTWSSLPIRVRGIQTQYKATIGQKEMKRIQEEYHRAVLRASGDLKDAEINEENTCEKDSAYENSQIDMQMLSW